MKISMLLLLNIIQYLILAGVIFSIIYTIIKNKNYRLGFLIGILVYLTIILAINSSNTDLWNNYGRGPISTLVIIISMSIAAIYLGFKEPNETLKSTIFFIWAIYSIDIYFYYSYVPVTVFFDYPNGPNLMNEFWSYFGWAYIEDNRPITTIISGSVILETIKLFRRRKEFSNKGVKKIGKSRYLG